MDIRQPNPTQAAGILRAYLKTLGIELKHTAALEAVARTAGYTDWQSMAADMKSRGNEEPALLRQDSATEYTFVGNAKQRVWVTVGNVSAYLGPTDEGVVVDLFAKGNEDGEADASTYLFYSEALDAVLERHGVSRDDVAEWVGLHYRKNFEAESPEAQLDWVNRYAEMHAQDDDEEPDAPRYVHGTWTHLFGAGIPEVTVRLVFDRELNQVLCMDIQTATKWVGASSAQIQDVEDSLKNANDDALENPQDWGLEASDELPVWAQEALAN